MKFKIHYLKEKVQYCRNKLTLKYTKVCANFETGFNMKIIQSKTRFHTCKFILNVRRLTYQDIYNMWEYMSFFYFFFFFSFQGESRMSHFSTLFGILSFYFPRLRKKNNNQVLMKSFSFVRKFSFPQIHIFYAPHPQESFHADGYILCASFFKLCSCFNSK